MPLQNQAEKVEEEERTDDILHLGVCLSLMDKYLNQFKNRIETFTGEEDEYKVLLYLIARQRCRDDDEMDTVSSSSMLDACVDKCYQNLLTDSERFVKIYHERNGRW